MLILRREKLKTFEPDFEAEMQKLDLSEDGAPFAASWLSAAAAELGADATADVFLRVRPNLVYAMYRRGEIPGGQRLGRTIRFFTKVVVEWMRNGEPRRTRRGH